MKSADQRKSEKYMKAVKVINKPSKEMIELVIEGVSETLASTMASFPDAQIIYNEQDKPIYWRGDIKEGDTFGESDFEKIPVSEFPALFLEIAKETISQGSEPFDWEPAFVTYWPADRQDKFYECQENMKKYACLWLA